MCKTDKDLQALNQKPNKDKNQDSVVIMITLGAKRKKFGRVLKRAVKIFELCRNHEAQLREWNLQTSGFTLLPALHWLLSLQTSL